MTALPRPTLSSALSLVALDTVDSTNEEARRRAQDGAADGTVVWAKAQTSGRGRRGRKWVSEPGNLYCSIIVRPHYPASVAMQLSFVAATAVAVSQVMERGRGGGTDGAPPSEE